MKQPQNELTVRLGDDLYAMKLQWGSIPKDKGITSISELATDSRDRLFVFQRTDPPVLILDRQGKYEASWGTGLITDAHGLFITPKDEVFLVDRDGHQVLGCSIDGTVKLTLGRRHRPRFQQPFNHPTDVAVGTDGTIYIADGYANSTVHCFAPSGEHRWTRGRPGPGRGEFFTPHGIWMDKRGRLLVADRENDRVELLDSEGNYVDEWTGFFHPMDIGADAAGNIYVTDQAFRISMFALDGTLVGRCRTHAISHGIWIDSRGDIYLADMPASVTKLVRMPKGE